MSLCGGLVKCRPVGAAMGILLRKRLYDQVLLPEDAVIEAVGGVAHQKEFYVADDGTANRTTTATTWPCTVRISPCRKRATGKRGSSAR